MSDTVKVSIESEEVLQAYQELLQRSLDLTPVNRAIAGVMADATERAFRDQKDPATGEAWAPLADSTAESKVNGSIRGKTPILTVSGILGLSYRPSWGKDFAMLATGDIRAATHHFGAERGSFGSTGRGSPIPFGDIPARPHVGLGSDDNEEIIGIISHHLLPD